MDDLISRQAAIDATAYGDPVCDVCRKAIMKIPSAERKRGKWVPMFNGKFTGGAYWFKCSECGRVVPDVRNGGWNFCPSCGVGEE